MRDIEVPLEPIVSDIIVYLRHAFRLATGVQRCEDPAPSQIPSENMKAAYTIAVEAESALKELRLEVDKVPGGFASTAVRLVINLAVSSAVDFRIHLEMRADKAPPGGEVAPAFCTVLRGFLNTISSAREFFEVLSGELPYSSSPIAQLETAYTEWWYDQMEAAISFLPIVGPIFDLSMAVVGKSLYGRQRSPLERVIIGIGVFVPLLVEVAVQGTKITARTVLLMKVNKVGSTNIKRFNKIFEAIPIAVAMRELTPEQIKEVLLLVEKLGKGVKLAQEEASRFAYLAGRLYEAGTAGHWLEIIKSKTGTAEIKGRHITDLSGVKFREGEREAGEVIARELNEQVIHLPELGPDEFQKGIKKAIREGEKHPDVLIGREFGDVKRATTSNAYAYRTNMTKGGRQGGTIIADLQGTQLRASELEKQLPGLWGSSGGRKIHRVIIVDGGKAKVFHRPQQFSPLAFTPPVNATAIELHKVWDEVQKEAQQ